MAEHRLRRAVRALIIDDRNHLLMVRLKFAHASYWVLPGGGIEDGEDVMDALQRELREEVGLVDAPVDAHIWDRTHLFSLTDGDGVEWDGQHESCHLVRVAHFEPQPEMTGDELRQENLVEHRWWSLESIDGHVGDEVFVPHDITRHVRLILEHGPPASPFVLHQDSSQQ